MKLPIEYPLIIFILPHLLVFTTTPVDAQLRLLSSYCYDDDGNNYTIPSAYKTNLDVLLLDLTNKASLSLFNNQTIGENGIDRAYGLYMCRGDLDEQQCHDCVSAASTAIIDKCPNQKQAIVWYELCLLHYANTSIFSREDESVMYYQWSKANSSTPEYSQIISSTVEIVINQAAHNTSTNGYGTSQSKVSSFVDLYVMGQCTPDIVEDPCERCLRVALSNMGACCGTARVSMAMYLPSCWLRYAQAPFVGQGNTPSESPLAPPMIESPTTQLDFGPPPPPPPTPTPTPTPTIDHSRATTVRLGGISFKFMLAMTMILLLSTF